MAKRKITEEERRRNQARTYIRNNGRKAYRENGRKGGGKNSPGSFTSESGRRSALLLWEKRRRLRLEQIKQEASNAGTDTQK